jgi:hypothetical protein
VIAPAEVLGGMTTPENENSDQIQDHGDSVVRSREHGSQGLDDRLEIPQTREFVQISPTSPPKIISAQNSKKRPRSDSGRDIGLQERNPKTRWK